MTEEEKARLRPFFLTKAACKRHIKAVLEEVRIRSAVTPFGFFEKPFTYSELQHFPLRTRGTALRKKAKRMAKKGTK